jgi:6-phosphogluconolactonase/glucosamine-6-phosphate isomerase/deaminase
MPIAGGTASQPPVRLQWIAVPSDEKGHIESNGDPQMYDLEDLSLSLPALPDNVIVKPTPDDVIDALAADLVGHAIECVTEYGDFHLAFSARPAFDVLYRRLMVDPACRALPWRESHVWLIDERCDGPEAGADFAVLREWFGDHADIPADQMHAIPVGSDAPDEAYEAALRGLLEQREQGGARLDYVLLTAEPDGATAGLHGACPAPADADRLVQMARTADAHGEDRVSLTTACVNTSRFVAVLLTDPACGPLVRRVVDGGGEAIDGPPIARINPRQGKLRWYLDAATAQMGS